VRHPRNEQVYSSIKVREKGVCGSGDYEQFVRFEKNGKKQLRHHILDPSTMESADRSIGVTVIADNAEMADAIATTLFIMGPKTGRQFLTEEFSSIAALWFTSEGQVIRTENFPQ
jgi:thiamine biosynthesis lipoprotein